MTVYESQLDFYFCIFDGVFNELFDWKRDLRLEVTAGFSQSASIYMKTEWRAKRADEGRLR